MGRLLEIAKASLTKRPPTSSPRPALAPQSLAPARVDRSPVAATGYTPSSFLCPACGDRTVTIQPIPMRPEHGMVRCNVACSCGAIIGLDPPPWFRAGTIDGFSGGDIDAKRSIGLLLAWMPWNNPKTNVSHPKPIHAGQPTFNPTPDQPAN